MVDASEWMVVDAVGRGLVPSICIVAIGEIGGAISSANFDPIKTEMFRRHRQFHELCRVLVSGSKGPKLTEEIAPPW